MAATSYDVTIATANTHFGQLLRATESLAPIAHADIILLQEVITPELDVLERYLEPAGFRAVYIEPKFGLVVAFRRRAKLKVGAIARSVGLQKMSLAERMIIQRSLGREIAYTEHGCIVVEAVAQSGQKVMVVNTHLTVPPKFLARGRQVRRLGGVLATLDAAQPLIVAGDMNHYPRPWPVDEDMRRRNDLRRVDLLSEPTWRAHSVRRASLLRAVAYASRRPLEAFDGQHDAMLYRGAGMTQKSAQVVDIASDHRAIVTRFTLR